MLRAGDYRVTDDDPDCAFCVRHQHDAAVVSNAFFAAGAGSALLELSLSSIPRKDSQRGARERPETAPPRLRVMAGGRRPEPDSEPEAAPPTAPPTPVPPFTGLRYFSERVFISPKRVVVRTDAAGEIVEVVADSAAVQVRHDGQRTVVTAGDVELTSESGRLRGRVLQ